MVQDKTSTFKLLIDYYQELHHVLSSHICPTKPVYGPIESLGRRLLCSKNWALYFWAVLQKSPIMLLRKYF